VPVEAPAPATSPGPPRPDGWLGLSWPQLGWLLRLAELPAVLVLVAAGHPQSRRGELAGLLAVASAAWVAWLVVRPWRAGAPARGRAALALMLVIAAASGLATMIAGNSAILAGIAAIQAGTTLDAVSAVSVPLAGVAGVAVGSLVFDRPSAGIYLAFYGVVLAGATLGGVARGLHRQQLGQARRLLAQEQQTRAEQDHAAALAERARIAREIHDILAHSLADLSIQLEVADALLSDSADTTGALERVRHAHRLAGEGLDETRRAVHALRSDLPPLPDALAVIVGTYGEARLELDGPVRPLPAAASLALIRTAQEALVNARKHAPGRPVSLRLRYGPGQVDLTVRDGARPARPGQPGPPPEPAGAGVGGGYGLAGMRERLRLAGGSLTAGPVEGGWVVRAEVPG
jgi:signal transduction histidine kinase